MRSFKIFIYLIVVSFVIFCFYQANFSLKAQETLWQIGVVDFDRLIQAHSLSKQLQSLDQKIFALEEKGESFSSTQLLGQKDYLKLQTLQQEAETRLQQELDRIQVRLKEERVLLQKKFHAEEEEILKEIRTLEGKQDKEKPALPLPERVTSKTKKQGSSKLAKDLILLRERQITAKRLELQGDLKSKLLKIKREQQAVLNDYELEILKRNQNKKINLKLKLQTAPDEDSQSKILEELKKLEEQEATLKEIKIAQLKAELDRIQQAESKKIELEVLAFRKKLNKDISDQLKSRNLEGLGLEMATPEKKKLYQKYEQTKNEYQQKFDALAKKYQAKFEAKKRELAQRISSEEKRLLKKALEQQEYVSKAKTTHQKSLEKEIARLKEQRKRIYERILEDIKKKVAAIARQEKISQVVGYYLVNINCKDLTVQVLDEMGSD